MLRAAGIEVVSNAREAEAAALQSGFLRRVREGRPMVTLKLATSFDGRIATATGESQWITGPEARRHVHALRMRHDAVLVGGETARADDPSLTVRGLGASHQPVRIVAARQGNIPRDGTLARTAGAVPVWILHGDREGEVSPDTRAFWEKAGARLIPVSVAKGGQLDPQAMLSALGAAGLTRVFCEGGGALAASLLQADRVDEVVGFTAGVMLGAEGRPALGALGLDRLADAPRFRLAAARSVGGDVMHRWVRA